MEFSGDVLNRAILVIAEENRGYVEDLIGKLKDINLVSTNEEAKELITTLGLMGYLAYGLTPEYVETWKATKLALEEKEINELYQKI